MIREENDGLLVLAEWKINDTIVSASQGSVLSFTGDAIVNAANNGCICGGGVDGAISKAGGESLHDARLALPILRQVASSPIRCETGDAKITVGGELDASYCIHAVGPDYRDITNDSEADALLASTYASALARAKESGKIHTLAFALISAGIFRGKKSLQAILQTSVNAIKNNVYPGLRLVHLVAFSRAERKALLAALTTELGPPHNDYSSLPPAKQPRLMPTSETLSNSTESSKQEVLPPKHALPKANNHAATPPVTQDIKLDQSSNEDDVLQPNEAASKGEDAAALDHKDQNKNTE